jgi:hypothetical protein
MYFVPGSSVAALVFPFTHTEAVPFWPFVITLNAAPEPPVTTAVLTISVDPLGHLLTFGPVLYATFSMVVPLPPAQVVVLINVFRFVTDVPDPPVADSGVQPETVLLLIETPLTVTGGGETSFEQLAPLAAADDGDDNGIAINEPAATTSANRRNGTVRRIKSPPRQNALKSLRQTLPHGGRRRPPSVVSRRRIRKADVGGPTTDVIGRRPFRRSRRAGSASRVHGRGVPRP